jgi:surface protein
MYSEEVCLFWTVTVFDQCFFRLLFLNVDCDCNRSSVHPTVFNSASAFNGDLNQWDVAKVTTMKGGKSIRIEENDLT